MILVTGPNGFLGKRLVSKLLEQGLRLKFISRSINPHGETLLYKDFISGCYDRKFFSDVTVIIHLAAVAHQWKNLNSAEIGNVNLDFTARLLELAPEFSLEHFIFVSSIAVSLLDKGIVMDTQAYALAKKDSEELILKTKEKMSSLTVTILRPPLIYGPGAPGNFFKLVNLLKKPILLPFGSFKNKRSFIFLDHFCEAIEAVVHHPKRGKIGIYEIADDWAPSVTEFMRQVIVSMKGKAQIFPFPPSLLRMALSLAGRKEVIDKLNLELVVDNNTFKHDYPTWQPSLSFEQTLKKSFKVND